MKPLFFFLVICAIARAAAPPSITTASPNVIDAGGSYFPMTINGSGFGSGSLARWGVIRLSTTFVSATQLTAEITPDLRMLSGMFNLTVVNPDGIASSPYLITVAPGLSTVTPAGVLAGSPATAITAKGFGFRSRNVLVLNAVTLPTIFVDAGTLTAVIPANALALASVATIKVLNPFDGNTSGAVNFNIRAIPAIASAAPNPVDAGGAYFVMAVSGSGFTSTSIVNWGAGPVATAFVSSTQLQAAITPELRSLSGTFNLTVSDAGSASNAFPVVISPVLFAISPAAATVAGPAVALMATGAGFTRSDTLVLIAAGQQSPLATTYLNSTTLGASIPQGVLRVAGSAAIQVVDSAGAAHSLPQPFTITPPVPAITSLIPNAATVGAASFFMTVNGVNFAPGGGVLWNGVALTTAFQGSTQLSAAVPASLVQTVGTAAITIANASSNSVSFTINPPPPTISALLPISATAASSFILTVTCKNCAGAVVQWNGTPLATTQVSATQVSASIPSILTVMGTAAITLVNPIGAVSNAVQFTIYPPAPAITSLSPNAATEGFTAFTLSVAGTGFAAGSTVLWNGSPLVTTFVSASQVTAFVPATPSSSAIAAIITVASPGGAASNSLSFTIDPPRPIVSVLSPASATAGDPSFTLTVTGLNFAISCVAQWNGLPLSTIFVSPTLITATVPLTLIASSGAAILTVINPSGLISPIATFTIDPLAPLITTVSPSTATVGGAAFTLSISGVGFVPGAAVLWNAAPLPTVIVSSSQLTASVPASLIAGAATVAIAVAIPGAISNLLALTIAPPLPATTTAGIVNTASLLPSIAPGSLFSILGASLAPGDAAADTMPLPNSLNGTSVTINGIAAPLAFVSSTLINAQVPFEIGAGAATLLIQAGTVSSLPVTFAVIAAAPGVMRTPGSDHAMAQNNPGGEMNSPDNPAAPGQSITVYLTGQGVVDNPVATGAAAPSDPLSIPLAAVSAQLGGKDAVVAFTALAPGQVGLLRIDVVIPDVLSGEQPFDVSIGGVAANTTVLSVKTDP